MFQLAAPVVIRTRTQSVKTSVKLCSKFKLVTDNLLHLCTVQHTIASNVALQYLTYNYPHYILFTVNIIHGLLLKVKVVFVAFMIQLMLWLDWCWYFGLFRQTKPGLWTMDLILDSLDSAAQFKNKSIIQSVVQSRYPGPSVLGSYIF